MMARTKRSGRSYGASANGLPTLCQKVPTVFLAAGNQRPGFLVLTALMLTGLILLQRVPDPTRT